MSLVRSSITWLGVTAMAVWGAAQSGPVEPRAPAGTGFSSMVIATGETQCWDSGGNPVTCAGTGQDGDLQEGTTPASSRFTDNGDGTVTDNLTGLVWLRDPSCFGFQSWADALASAQGLASGSCGLSDDSRPGEWRMPNINEVRSLRWEGTYPALPPGNPFLNVTGIHIRYWSSTTVDVDGLRDQVWILNPDHEDLATNGIVTTGKSAVMKVWPVRGPILTSAPSKVMRTGQTQCWDSDGNPVTCAGTGEDGDLQEGTTPASSRFTDNGDGTVTDNLTGLVWLRDTSCFGFQSWADALASAQGLASGSCGLSDDSRPGEWRMPNINEVRSLRWEGTYPALPPGNPFLNVTGIHIRYWSSTTVDVDGLRDQVWILNPDHEDLATNGIVTTGKSAIMKVWPVRGSIVIQSIFSDGFEDASTAAWSLNVPTP